MATSSSSSGPEEIPSPSSSHSLRPFSSMTTTTTATSPMISSPLMATTLSASSSSSPEAFFTRHKVSPSEALTLCHTFIATHYPNTPVYPSPTQGFCSYTLCIGDAIIVQFRPESHRLHTAISSLARGIYGVYAPLTHFLGMIKTDDSVPLYVYSLTRIPGLSLAQFRLCPVGSTGEVRSQRTILVRDFARFLAAGWNSRRDGREVKGAGRLSSSLRWRCEEMRDRLPVRFRPIVEDVLLDLEKIERLPWVLTHGDVSPDNIMVEGGDATTNSDTGWRPGSLRGVVDWAESEYLPFGVGLYGAEELFGQSLPQWERKRSSTSSGTLDEAKNRFAYYASAGDLRRLFWEELEKAIPFLATDREFRATVEQARRLGILLWHGFAFDDGKLDRIVQEGVDDEEIQKLDMFLLGTDQQDRVSTDVGSRLPGLLRKSTGKRKVKEDVKWKRSSFKALVKYIHLPGQ